MVKEPNLASLLKRDYPGKLHTVIRIDARPPETARLDVLIENADRPVLLSLKDDSVGALDANELIRRDIPVRLFADGVALRDAADGCVYLGQARGTAIDPGTSQDSDVAYDGEKRRRRELIQSR